MLNRFKYKNIDKYKNSTSFWLIFFFLSASVIFLLLIFLKTEGGLIEKAKSLLPILNPRLFLPPILGWLLLTLIGYPLCLPLKKYFNEYIWLLSPIVAFGYLSLWVYPSYLGLSFHLCLVGAILVIVILYIIAWLVGALKKTPSPKKYIALFFIILIVSIFHMYPYSQLGMTSYSGTGINDAFYYACRTAVLVDQPLSERLPYLTEAEKGKLYLSRSAYTVRLNSIMGTTFLQASATVFSGIDTVTVFPILLVISVILAIIGVYLTARLGFHMSHNVALLAAALLGLNPFFFSISQSGFLRHLVGVVFLAPIFLMTVQGCLKKRLCFVYSLFFLLALYSNYTVITPIGIMFILGIISTVGFYLFIIWYFKIFKNIWIKSSFMIRAFYLLINSTFLIIFVIGIIFAIKYSVGVLVARIPLINVRYLSVTVQELLGLQPRPWMTMHKFTFLGQGTMAKLVKWFSVFVIGLGMIRFLIFSKKVLSASTLALFGVISILAFSFHLRGAGYSEFKYWSYITPFVCIVLASGVFWIAEKRQTFLTLFFSLAFVIFLFDINALNLYCTATINVAQAKNFSAYVDEDLKRLPELFDKVPRDKTILLAPMGNWDTAWAIYYGRKNNVTINKRHSFYSWPRAKEGELKLLDKWSYSITTEKLSGLNPIDRVGRFYLYEQ